MTAIPHVIDKPGFSADELWCDCGRRIECGAHDFPKLVRWEFCCACGRPLDWSASEPVAEK
jgi:hypothetical protein